LNFTFADSQLIINKLKSTKRWLIVKPPNEELDMAKTKDITVFIGRFSPFHNGHAEVLKRALETSHLVLVLVGSSGQARTTKNPFTFEERKQMIQNWFRSVRSSMQWHGELIVEPLYDHPYNDQAWIREVQDSVAKLKSSRARMDNAIVYLTGCDRDHTTWYLNSFGDLFVLDLVQKHPVEMELNATKIREILFDESRRIGALKAMVPKTTLEFLSDFQETQAYPNLIKEYEYNENYKKHYSNKELLALIQAARAAGLCDRATLDDLEIAANRIAPYPVSIQTVDNVVIQSGHVLVCVRDNFPGYGLWCLPGGHLDIDKRERLRDAAIRELQEETRIELSRAQLVGSIKDKQEFDHPDRSLKGRVITMAYLLKLDDSKPLPRVKPQKGEVKKVMWVPIAEALSLKNMDKWFDDHYNILQTMYGRLPTSG